MERLPAIEWIERCADALTSTAPEIGGDEALDLAIDLFRFERTAAMAPEAAVGFAAQQMAHPAPCLDRRRAPR